jgi:circadian clock protein KaiB
MQSDEHGAQLVLRLYVAGDARNSNAAISNLRSAIGECAPGRVNIEIVDILTEPERGMRDGVLVTPMLVKVAPSPERRVLGSLHDRLTLLEVLGLAEARRD